MGVDTKKDLSSFIFDNENIIDGLLEDLKKEMIDIIFSKDLSLFKKTIFIQGVFTYTNLILSSNQSLSDEEKNKKMLEMVNISQMLADDLVDKKYTIN